MTPHCFKFLAIQRHDSSIVVGPSSKDEKASGDPLQPGEADATGHPAEVRGRAQEDEPARHRLGTGGFQLGAASELLQPPAGGGAQVEEQPGEQCDVSFLVQQQQADISFQSRMIVSLPPPGPPAQPLALPHLRAPLERGGGPGDLLASLACISHRLGGGRGDTRCSAGRDCKA